MCRRAEVSAFSCLAEDSYSLSEKCAAKGFAAAGKPSFGCLGFIDGSMEKGLRYD